MVPPDSLGLCDRSFSIWRCGEMDLKRTSHVSSPQGIRWKDRFFCYVNVREYTGFIPSERAASSRDKRPLGVFVEIGVNTKSPSSP
jgi:hypothetical protein